VVENWAMLFLQNFPTFIFAARLIRVWFGSMVPCTAYSPTAPEKPESFENFQAPARQKIIIHNP
jgi:hypothetical protein